MYKHTSIRNSVRKQTQHGDLNATEIRCTCSASAWCCYTTDQSILWHCSEWCCTALDRTLNGGLIQQNGVQDVLNTQSSLVRPLNSHDTTVRLIFSAHHLSFFTVRSVTVHALSFATLKLYQFLEGYAFFSQK